MLFLYTGCITCHHNHAQAAYDALTLLMEPTTAPEEKTRPITAHTGLKIVQEVHSTLITFNAALSPFETFIHYAKEALMEAHPKVTRTGGLSPAEYAAHESARRATLALSLMQMDKRHLHEPEDKSAPFLPEISLSLISNDQAKVSNTFAYWKSLAH